MSALRTYFRLIAEDKDVGPSGKFMRPVLGAASSVYGFGVKAVRGCYEKKMIKRKRLPFPVVSVGNLTWGGSGKTPLVEYLARKVNERRRNPLVLTRGYSKDETEQYKNNLPETQIGTGRNRERVAKKFSRRHKIDVAILDDGFQHWRVERDIEIVTVNALNPFGNGKLIPRGILREPLSALSRAAIIVISHVNLVKPEELDKLKEELQKLSPSSFIAESFLEPLFFYRAKKRSRVSIDRLKNQRVTTFSAVGVPRSFQLLLTSSRIKPIRNFEFTDHHKFSRRELEEVKSVSDAALAEEIITTEKDFYRSPDIITDTVNPLILATRLRIKSGEEVLTDRLFRLLGVQK